MTQHHPITPPPKLVEQLRNSAGTWLYKITNAYQAGADRELEACVDWLDDTDCEDPQEASLRLRWHRRPKPPSLKEQGLAALEVIPKLIGFESERDAIRRALEALDD